MGQGYALHGAGSPAFCSQGTLRFHLSSNQSAPGNGNQEGEKNFAKARSLSGGEGWLENMTQ